MKGILLMCHSSSYYGKWAFNMAHSIKDLCNIPVHLVYDKQSVEGINLNIFDSKEEVNFSDDFCYEKINIYERSPFGETLYLDVDGVMINNPEIIFEELKDNVIWSQPMGQGKRGDSISYTWANNDLVWERFNLSEETIFNTVQTSIVYFTKEAKEFFNQLKVNYEKKLKPIEYREMWGKRKQHPDELYYSITMAQMNISLQDFRPVFFPEKKEEIGKILSDYFILSMYGGQNVKEYAKGLYDKIMLNLLRKKGLNHLYKVDKLYKNKFINIK